MFFFVKTNIIEIIIYLNLFILFQQINFEDFLFTDMLEEDKLFKGHKRVNKDDKQNKDQLVTSRKTITVIIEYIFIQTGIYYILSITVANKKYNLNRILNLKKNKNNKTTFE